MQALAAAPSSAPRRQVLVGTAFACVAGTMLVGGMLAVWLVIRDRAIAAEGTWVPPDVAIPEVPSNIMLISFLALVVFAQWAVYAARRGERSSAALALGATGLVAIAVVNAQAFVYSQMELPIAETAYGPMFYAVTGVFLVLMVVGLAFTVVTAFRVLGGRSDGDVVAAHALYWYFVAAAFAAIWLIVYVTK